MLSINITDVINVLKLIAPHLIALLVVLAAAIVVMIAVRKKERAKKFMIRRQALIALLAAIVTIGNLICFGPMSNMITLATGKGEVSDKTIAEARELSRTVAGEGIVLLENKGLLPLATGKKLNVFGWSSVSPYYGGTGSGGFSPDFETNTLLEGLESAGFETNKELSDFYRAYRTDRPEIGLFGQDWTLPEPPLATYSDAMMENAKSFSDTAVIVIARSGGEGADLPKDVTAGVTYNENSTEYSDFSAGQHILQLDKTERDLFDRVCADFSNVIVVYTGANTFEMTFVDEYPSIKGLVWCQGLGQGGFPALGSVLSGSVNPSGKTSDTFARNIANAPWFNNFGNYEFDNVEEFTLDSGDPILGVSKPHFVNYVEGIYVGYRFYETAAVEGLIDYDKEVQYPFGYGLSYTTFEQTMGDLNVASDGNITVDVTVTNTGSVAGKDVVELYDTPPYTNGGIEKAAVNLVAFDKTKLLEPGESQTLTLSFTQESLASYDANVNKAYVLEEGEYVVSLRTDSHTVVDEKTFTVGDTIVYGENNKRSTDEVAATNHFDSALGNATYLSRADHFANFTEATASPASYSMTDEAKAEYVCNLNYDPTALNNENDEMPVTGANNGLVLEDLRGADYDDPRWEQLLDELTVDEMVPLIGLGGYQTIEVSSVKKARTTDCDGPASITNNFTGKYSIGMPSSVTLACTFNKELALEYGRLMGKMCDEMEASGWYAPAINTHRAALGGREFEYVSEDGLLSGTQIAQEVIGAKEYGVYSYIKHFAMNDQETNRWNMVSIWAPEQAIREIYLKPFEIAVKTGGAQAVMSSYSYIGPHWSGANDSLLNKVLRDEWGFRGMVITDYFLGANFMDADACIRNGNDLMLVAYEMGDNTLSDQTSATGIKAMRTAAKNIMYTVVNSRAYEPENLRIGLYGWQIALIIADLVVLALLALWEVKTFKKYKEVNITK